MTAPKLLNLDQILQSERKIVLDGKEYPIVDQSVEQMITAIQLSEAVENVDDPVVIAEQVIKAVEAIIPNCPPKVIRALPMHALNAILEFANISAKEAVERSSEEGVESTAEGSSEEKK